MKKRYFIVPLFLILFLTFCTKRSDIKDGAKISQQDLELLMNQLEGHGCYWMSTRRDPEGTALSRMDILISTNIINTKYDCQNFACRILISLSKGNNLERAVPLLIHHLKYKSLKPQEGNNYFPLRYLAIEALSAIKDPRAVDALVEVIHHTRECSEPKQTSLCSSKQNVEKITQYSAIEALSEIGTDKPDVIHLFIVGLKDKSPYFRSSSAYALSKLKAYQSIDLIVTLFKQDPDESVRNAAAEALGIFGPKAAKAVPNLIQVAKQSKEPETAIMSSLAKIGTTEAIDALKEFSISSDVQLSNEAKKALSLFEESKK
jgi:HEAT repeats/PBS lyase HEAT-like repeat